MSEPLSTDHVDIATVCEHVAAGMPMVDIAKGFGVTYFGLSNWIRRDQARSDAVKYARQAYGELVAEEIMAIADDGQNDTYIDENGNQRTDYDVVARSKLRVSTRQWMATRLAPGTFGDKVTTEVVGPGGGPVNLRRFDASDEDLLKLATAHRMA